MLLVRLRMLITGLVMLGLYAVVLFGAAGRLDLPMFWAVIGIWAAGVVAGTLVLPADLLAERLEPGPGVRERWFRPVMISLYVGHFITAGLDAGRLHLSGDVPAVLRAAGLAGMAGMIVVALWCQVINRFFSSAVRIQADRGHVVVTSGPYRVVRHPAYAAFIWMPLCTSLALGSWIAVAFIVPLAALLVARIRIEDAMLQAELPGYAEYASRVRYRVLPGVW